MNSRDSFFRAMLASLLLAGCAVAQSPTFAQPRARILESVDDTARVSLRGNIHPLVTASRMSQPADDGTPMEHMILFLKGDDTQEAQLAQLIAQQHDPKSALYHHYLTPQEFGSQFGVAKADLGKVTAWLRSRGLTVEETPAGNRAIVFSGTAAQVEYAFKTEIRKYAVGGATHFANASDPQIPAALAETVGGVVKLHDFRHSAHISKAAPITANELANPQFTYGSNHYLAPADYATLYDINPLYSAGINGTGQTIAVIARSNISMSDVQMFRSDFGLKANDPQIVITNSDPGVLQNDSVETTLDAEWAGAVAPGATVKVIISESTNSADGIDLASLYAVNNNVAPIVSLSYGSCEAGMGSAEVAFYNSLWQQAAVQGQSVMVSSGDSGAAGCYAGSSSSGSGQAVNGLCSSPYATCVGGTQFAEGSNPGQYWLPGNNPGYGSAIGYIPETVWNESGSNGGSGLWASGGGASIFYSKPSWQAGPGVPADGRRDVPDISLTASGHDAYLIDLNGSLNAISGTSASAPSFAGLMALVNQKMNARQGLANSALYPLAVKQASGGAAVFHDTITGNNSVPGVTGFSATAGYDRAVGLGSVDANLLVNHWADVSNAASLSLSASSTSLSVNAGQTIQTTVTTAASASLKFAVTLTVAGAPAGLTATFTTSTIASPGSGSAVLNVTAGSTVAAATYSLTVTAMGGGQTATLAISVVVAKPTFTLATSAASVSAMAGNTVQVSVTTSPQNGFTSTVALSVSGLPAGATAAFSPTTLSGGAEAKSTLTFTLAKTVKGGSYPITISAVGGSVTQSSSITLLVSVPPSCTLASNPTSVSLIIGQKATAQLSCGSVQGTFGGPLALSISGTPSGVIAQANASTMTAGSAVTLTLTSATTTVAGKYSISVTASGSGFTQTLAVPLTIPAPGFALSTSATSVSAVAGGAAQLTVSITPQNGFSAAVGLSASGLPVGVTAAFSAATLAGTAAGTSALTLTAAKTTRAGSYPITVTASGGGVTQTSSPTLTVSVPPSCTLSVNPASVTINAGQAASVSVSCGSVQGAFGGPIGLSVSGAPAGVSVQAVATVLTPGTSTALNIGASLSAATGKYSLSLTASGSGFTQTVAVPLTVSAANMFSLTAAQGSVTIKAGASGQVTVTSIHYGIFNSAVNLSVTGLPAGVTASLSKTAIAAPGDGSTLATFSVASTVKPGTYPVVFTGTSAGITESAPVSLTVAGNSDFTLAVNVSSLTMPQGGAGTIIVSTGNFTGGFSSTITITFSGLGVGMNWGVLGATTGNNLVNVSDSFSAASYTPVGTYPVTITATGAGMTHSAVVQMTVVAPSTQTHK
jgi:pseudomonalisin